jgi:hypothetical protein
VTEQDADLSRGIYVRVVVLEAATILLLWIVGRVFG